jgi:hypothetical protein
VVTNGRIVGPFPDAAGEEATRAGPRLCYLGSIGPQYQPGSMLALAKRIKRDYPATAFSVFTQDAAALEPYLQEELELDWITVESIDPADVPRILSRQDIGLALRTRTLSMQAVAPIKIGDYLLAGLPIIGNAEVGPVGGAVEQACLMPADAPPEAIRSWIADVLANRACWRKRCRKLGVERFSLERSIDDYLAALGGLEEMNGVAEDPGSSDLPRPATGSVR